MKISVLGDRDTVVGFQLAGVKDAHVAEEPKKALEALKALIKDKDIGMIIMSERLADKLREELKRLSEGRVAPLIVEIPDKKGPIEKRVDPIKELVKRAVGVEIKFG